MIDLITVSRFEIGGEEILVPERIDPGSQTANLAPTAKRLAKLETLLPDFTPSQGNWVPRIDDEVPDVFTERYREAAGLAEQV